MALPSSRTAARFLALLSVETDGQELLPRAQNARGGELCMRKRNEFAMGGPLK
jgi:hypothetical protein